MLSPPTSHFAEADHNHEKEESGSKEGKGGDFPSRLIDARIKELNDWRGTTLAVGVHFAPCSR
jgi:hypothetical protein